MDVGRQERPDANTNGWYPTSDSNYRGLLCIGDPHLASRTPGFRQDDYPRVVLEKLKWCFKYAKSQSLLPCLLGDLFHWPRDNANWLLRQLLEMLDEPVLAIMGNHDCAEDQLTDDDSLGILEAAGRLRLVDRSGPWCGTMSGEPVIVGGTSWGAELPEKFSASQPNSLVFWLTHLDIRFPGYDEAGWITPKSIPGIHAVINGHIHRSLPDVIAENTTWMNPGNISRIKRSDSTRERVPSVLRIDVAARGAETDSRWRAQLVEIPHAPFENVFYAEVAADPISLTTSAFVSGLAELVARRTATGAGLREFLSRNLGQFEPRVAREINLLAQEILQDGIDKETVSPQ